jgi:chromosomal replication initiation ATPase DnaA
MTPTQIALHQARKARLARLAAAAKPSPAEPRREQWMPRAAPRLRRRPAAQPPKGPDVAEIQREVCAHYGVALADLLSQRRPAALVRPRQVAVYLCRRLTSLSMARIGVLFGGRDHTTVLISERKIAALLQRDAALVASLATLTAALRRDAGPVAPPPPSSSPSESETS